MALAVLTAAAVFFVLIAVGPRTGAYRTLTVLSASMRPTFAPGSVVITRPTPVTDLVVGDVITYRIPVEDHRVVTHRIVEIVEIVGGGDRPVVRTQGDANNAPDPWLTRFEDDVAWRTVASVPSLGYAINALREPVVGRGLVLVVPVLLCGLWLAELWRRSDDETDDLVVPAPALGVMVTSRTPWLARHQSGIDASLALVSGAERLRRWTDEVVSGRRWQRRQAARA